MLAVGAIVRDANEAQAERWLPDLCSGEAIGAWALTRELARALGLMRRGEAWLSEAARGASRMKIGHPQGILEAFANFYDDVAAAIHAKQTGHHIDGRQLTFATARDGVLGMKFVEAAVESNANNGRWVDAKVDFAEIERNA